MIAEELVIGARQLHVPSPEFRRVVRNVQRLGYSSLERRVLVACLVAQYATSNGEPPRFALSLVREARRRVRVLRRTAYKRGSLSGALQENEDFLLL